MKLDGIEKSRSRTSADHHIDIGLLEGNEVDFSIK